jgi:hypothetical protein
MIPKILKYIAWSCVFLAWLLIWLGQAAADGADDLINFAGRIAGRK